MPESPKTLEQLQEIARQWQSHEQATVNCPLCGNPSLDCLVNSEGEILDSICSNCGYDPRELITEAQIEKKAEVIFGDHGKAQVWLNKRKGLLHSQTGRVELLELLNQLDSGMF